MKKLTGIVLTLLLTGSAYAIKAEYGAAAPQLNAYKAQVAISTGASEAAIDVLELSTAALAAYNATMPRSMSISLDSGLFWQDTSTGTGVSFVLGSTITVTEMQAYAKTAPTALSYVSLADQNNKVVISSMSFSAGKAFTNILSSTTVIPKSTRLYLHNQAIDGDSIMLYMRYYRTE